MFSVFGSTGSQRIKRLACIAAAGVLLVPLVGVVSAQANHRPMGCTVIIGTSGADVLVGGGGCDRIEGMGGADEIHGAGGNDSLDGGADNDTIFGEAGNDRITGGEECPVPIQQLQLTVDGILPALSMVVATVLDVVCDVMETLIALPAEQGNDVLSGGLGDDSVEGGLGNDTVDGDEGNDTVSGDQLNNGLLSPITTTPIIPIPADGNDIVRGGDGADNVFGRGGNDIVEGNGGVDPTIDGGGGQDSCTTDGPPEPAPTNCEAVGP